MGVGGGRNTGRSVGCFVHSRELAMGPETSYSFSFLDNPSTQIFQKDVKGHFGCVNAIEASLDERLLTSGGDDHRVLLWNIADVQVQEEPKPAAIMRQVHYSNIFSLAFSNRGEQIFSAGNDASLLVHDVATQYMLNRFKAGEAIYSVSTNPIDDSIIITASEDAKVRLYDLRTAEETVAVSGQGTMYCAQFNPSQANLVSICSGIDGVSIHDCRMLERPCFRLGQTNLNSSSRIGVNSVMYGQWNRNGDGIFATRSRNCPIYYDLNSGKCVELKDSGYLNSCTVKSCSFISSNLVMTGSDDWNIYIWKLPQNFMEDQVIESAYRVLKGHRSIVNHTRYSPLNRLLFSSGVEKIIKLWSEWDLHAYYHDPVRRPAITARRISEPRNDDSVEEDLSMLAFFDILTTNGGDDDLYTLDDSLEINDLEDSSDDEGAHFVRLPRVRAREGSIYVISSPELSEPELLPESDSLVTMEEDVGSHDEEE